MLNIILNFNIPVKLTISGLIIIYHHIQNILKYKKLL